MKPARAIVLLTVTVVLSFGLMPSEAAAAPVVSAQVLSAGYDDLDSDGLCDDIYTSLEIRASRYLSFQTSYVYVFLEKPSGLTYTATYRVTGRYSQLTLGLGWLNTVSEEGWYWFYFYVEIVEFSRSYWAYDEVCFDPPTEGVPGLPNIQIMSVTSQP